MNTYCIQVQDQVEVEALNPMSPVHMKPLKADPSNTTFTICTDQSGMLGLLRHLHNLGIDITDISIVKKRLTPRTPRKS
jgi:hypothetical protein